MPVGMTSGPSFGRSAPWSRNRNRASGQDRAQLFHRDRQQKVVAQIAAAIVSGEQYACAAPILRHGPRLRARRAFARRPPAIDPSKS